MDTEEARRLVAAARVGRLATLTPDSRPHLVPCCYALVGDTLFTAVDAKPKSTTALRRIENVAAHDRVSLLVDHYEEDWSKLWWVRADGQARILGPGAEEDAARRALKGKYPQSGTWLSPGLSSPSTWTRGGAGPDKSDRVGTISSGRPRRQDWQRREPPRRSP